MSTSTRLRRPRRHQNKQRCCRYPPQPERLISGSDDFTMFLWEPAEGKKHVARMTGHVQLINHVVFSPDGRCEPSRTRPA